MRILHFSYASDGGASRAGRRASLACQSAGLASSFAFVEGEPHERDDVRVTVRKKAPDGASAQSRSRFELSKTLRDDIQWDLIPNRRTSASNTLFSIPYPGADLSALSLFDAADVIHLHWPTWGVTPRAIANWLARGKVVFWTLHDMWAMTGGCHYSAGCRQFETFCMKCPQLTDDVSLVANSFEEKRQAYANGGKLFFLSPSHWLAKAASQSAILGSRHIEVVRNPIELDIFKPCEVRDDLRGAFGIAPNDFVLMMGSGDLREKRKGADLLFEAVRSALADGSLVAALPMDARFTLILVGKSADFDLPDSARLLNFGEIKDDKILADILCLADVVAIPSLEDNYPNLILEAMACGTPVIGFDAGGVPEMIDDEITGVVVRPAGSAPRLKEGILHFAQSHFQSGPMRAACRASAQAHADPARIGAQLRGLYENARGGPVKSVDPELHARVLSAFANVPASPDAGISPSMVRFPSNLAILARSTDPEALRETVVAPLPTCKTNHSSHSLVTLRTYHEHHSARSGPYQFFRHLPKDRYRTSHFAVPLGDGLVSKTSELFRKAGALMGASGFSRQGNAWLAESEVFLACAHEETDIVHFIDGDLGGMLLPNVPAKLFPGGRRPIFVATYHQPEEIFRPMVNENVMGRHDGIVALCRPQRDFLASLFPEDRIAVIPHGIDVSFFSPPPQRARIGGKTRTLRLLMVGHWLRDVKLALAAFARLKTSEFTFELRVISPRFTVSVADPSIKILKGLTDEELREEYRSADLLYLPLTDATANNAVLEAMACGLPIVSTAVGGVPEAVGDDAGVLCAPGEVEDFVTGVLRLLRSPDQLMACGRAGRRRAEGLSWARIGEMHHEFYERLIEMRQSNEGS